MFVLSNFFLFFFYDTSVSNKLPFLFSCHLHNNEKTASFFYAEKEQNILTKHTSKFNKLLLLFNGFLDNKRKTKHNFYSNTKNIVKKRET